ncbi:MAG: 4-hydroxy-tetrahydrodipicolinate synthase [Chloroherpetonaceae bacterium]|nr:4-hydroxy-tetrahydrodipicolinate synthase [Chloroherpetonaceae bacterium]
MSYRTISGSAVALVTPFKSDGKIDESALRRLVEFQIQGGTDILIPCGTTGESPTLSDDEQRRVIEIVLEAANGRAKVIGGAGTNDTRHAVKLAKAAEQAGVQGILSVAPYYNKPSQEGFFQHYAAVAEAVSVPIIIYNVPGRTGANISVETMLRLAEQFSNILAVKEASGNMVQIEELLRQRPSRLSVMSGDDYLTLPMMALGGDGVISVAANQIPRIMKLLVEAMRFANLAEAQSLHHQYLPLMMLNFIELNPIPVKYALARMGLIEPYYRLPLTPPSDANKSKIDAELQRLGLIKEVAAA